MKLLTRVTYIFNVSPSSFDLAWKFAGEKYASVSMNSIFLVECLSDNFNFI